MRSEISSIGMAIASIFGDVNVQFLISIDDVSYSLFRGLVLFQGDDGALRNYLTCSRPEAGRVGVTNKPVVPVHKGVYRYVVFVGDAVGRRREVFALIR